MCRWRLLKSESETIPNRLRCCRRAQKVKKKNEKKRKQTTLRNVCIHIGYAHCIHAKLHSSFCALAFFLSSRSIPSSTRRSFSERPTAWTSRGHSCGSFFPPVHAFIYVAHGVQHSHRLSIFIDCCQLTLSRLQKRSYHLRDFGGNPAATRRRVGCWGTQKFLALLFAYSRGSPIRWAE